MKDLYLICNGVNKTAADLRNLHERAEMQQKPAGVNSHETAEAGGTGSYSSGVPPTRLA
jgi:hypothetical protein